MSVTDQLDKLIEKLKGKETEVNQLCRKLGLCIDFTIALEAEAGYFPEVRLGKEEIGFMAGIGADIHFDFYIFDA